MHPEMHTRALGSKGAGGGEPEEKGQQPPWEGAVQVWGRPEGACRDREQCCSGAELGAVGQSLGIPQGPREEQEHSAGAEHPLTAPQGNLHNSWVQALPRAGGPAQCPLQRRGLLQKRGSLRRCW